MKKFLKTLVIPALALMLIVGTGNAKTIINNFYPSESEIQEIQENEEENLGGYQILDAYPIGTSESVPVELGVGATQSIAMSTKNADHLDLNIKMTASSTASVLQWTYFFSDDGTNWYAEDAYTVTSDILATHGASDFVHSWTPGTTTAVMKNIGLSPLVSRYTKVIFTGDMATSSIFIKAITKQQVD